MGPVNRALGALFDLLIAPFSTTPPAVGLAAVSAVVSVGVLLAFRRLSDQAALDRVKRRITAGVYEIRLYRDDVRAILGSQLTIMRHTMTYFRLSMTPMLVIMVPIVIVVIQLQFRYAYESLEPGDATLVAVRLTDAGAQLAGPDGAGIVLEAPAGVRVASPLVWIPSIREANWRVVADAAGDHELTVRVGDRSFAKSLRVGGSTVRRSPLKPSGFFGQLVYPAEPALPLASEVESIHVGYRDADVSLLGLEMHWLVAFFILTMVFAFALARPLGVKI